MFDVLLDNLCSDFQVSSYVIVSDKSVSLNSLRFVHPEFSDLLGVLELVRSSLQDSLEYTGQVTDVELVVEVSSSLLELVAHFLVENQCRFAQTLSLISNVLVERLEVVAYKGLVDSDQGLVVRQHDHQSVEVAHQSRVDLERTCSGVHS